MESCRQILVVSSPSIDSVQGVMTPFTRDAQGCLKEAWPSFPVVLGRNGMAWDKSEGDGCSPIGWFPLVQAFGKARNPKISMPYQNIEGLEGVDDPSSRYYNRLIRRQDIADADWTSAERMEDYSEQYAWGVVVGYNWVQPKPHAGSCIFLHVWRTSQNGTAGCTAMEKGNMRKILDWLDPACHPHLVQGPHAYISGQS